MRQRRKKSKPLPRVVGHRVTIYDDSVTMTYLRHRDFYDPRASTEASAYYHAQTGDPRRPCHGSCEFIWEDAK